MTGRILVGIALCAQGVVASTGAVPSGRPLTLEERVQAQAAIERVYYSHQIGAARPFEEAVPVSALREKALRALRVSAALQKYWDTPITTDSLRRELERMTAASRMPERLAEIEAALHDDPVLVQECFVRPVLAERLARSFFSRDGRIHAAARQEAVALRDVVASGTTLLDDSRGRRVRHERGSGPLGRSDEEFRQIIDRLHAAHGAPTPIREQDDAFEFETLVVESASSVDVMAWRVEKRTWESWWAEAQPQLELANALTVADGMPLPRPKPSVDVSSGFASCGADNRWRTPLSIRSPMDGCCSRRSGQGPS
jgi:hypothetical protein